MIRVSVAEHSGFCYGVDRAVTMAYDNISGDGPLYCCGMLVHNEAVMSDLSGRGLIVVDDISDVPDGSRVLIRAHGIGEKDYEAAETKHLRIADATCPSVARIHRICASESAMGRTIVIIGTPTHPEVIGTAGWCKGTAPIIIDTVNAARKAAADLANRPVSVTVQTTVDAGEAGEIIEVLQETVADLHVFNTVCRATQQRQESARKLAQQSDVMFVIGSKKSSNTQKLVKICTQSCKNTFLIENVDDIQLTFDVLKTYNIGIVAGASTPSWVIKEVTSYMDQINKDVSETNFAEELEKSLKTLTNGQIVKGTVIGVDEQGAIVNVGFKSDGIVSFNEYSDDPSFTPDQIVIGSEIEVKVLRVNDAEGVVVLSKKRVDQQKFNTEVEEAFNNETPVQATVTEAVKGGVIAMYGPVRIFVPASQVTARRATNFDDFVGNVYDIKIIEYNKARKKVIGSIKAISEARRKAAVAELWANIAIGKEYTGTVKNLTNFGAFVDIGGVDGLIHISELSWKRIRNASEVLKIGDQVSVFIKDFNPETKKISLGYRRDEDNPWNDAENKYAVGTVVTATVMRMVPFGVFVEIVPGVDALVHISQISNVRINTPDEVLKVGQVVRGRIIEADYENKKINLSLRDVEPVAPAAEDAQAEDGDTYTEPDADSDDGDKETVIEI